MAFTTPPTWPPDTVVASDDLQILSDDITYLKAQTDLAVLSGCLVTRSTTQSIPDNSDTAILFTTEVFDQGGWITVTSDTVTVPAGAIPPGYTTIAIDVRVGVHFGTNSTGYRKATVNQNGSPISGPQNDASPTTTTPVNEASLTTAVAGDTFTVNAYQNSGGALDIISAKLSITVYKPVS